LKEEGNGNAYLDGRYERRERKLALIMVNHVVATLWFLPGVRGL